MLFELTRSVTKCDLISPPALCQKLVYCTQMETQTHGQTHIQTPRSKYTPKTFVLRGYNKAKQETNINNFFNPLPHNAAF